MVWYLTQSIFHDRCCGPGRILMKSYLQLKLHWKNTENQPKETKEKETVISNSYTIS